MRLALFSDLHANMAAMEACLAHAKEQGYDQLVVLGDLVGYGPSPTEMVGLCMVLERQGAVILRGNHDELEPASPSLIAAGNAQAIVADWTFHQLDVSLRQWLRRLPLSHVFQDVACVHSTVNDPRGWHYADQHSSVLRSLEAASTQHQARIVLCGHVHHQVLFYQGRGREILPFKPTSGVSLKVSLHRRWLATVGSVGQPRDADPRANYAIFDHKAGRITFYRVAYDIGRTVDALNKQGLPKELAERLEAGR